MNTFLNWLTETGDEKVAAMLGLSHHTARAWRLGTRRPRPGEAYKVKAIAPQIDFADIYSIKRRRERIAA